MSIFKPSVLEAKIAKNDDPMHKKKMWIKSYLSSAVLAAFGVFFLIAYKNTFLVFSCVLLAAAVFIFVDGYVTKTRK